MNNNQELPIRVKDQYALWQIIGIWLAGGAPMWILGWLVYPAMSLGLPPAEASLLRFNNDVPINLSLDMGAGTSDLQLAGLSLTDLDIMLGAGKSTVDLSGGWRRDLDVTINAGAANITVILPKDVGVRVEVEAGPHTIEASGLTQAGSVYTNAAYGVSDVTLQINMQAGIGQINLEVEQ